MDRGVAPVLTARGSLKVWPYMNGSEATCLARTLDSL